MKTLMRFYVLGAIFFWLGSNSFGQSNFHLLDRWAYGIQNEIIFIGDIGYINSGASLIIADFTDNLNPVKRNEIQVEKLVETFIVVDNYLYIGDRDLMWIFDVSDPVNPTFVNSEQLPEPAKKWYYYENRLYQIGNKKIYLYDLGDQARPNLLTSIATKDPMWDLVFYDTLIFASGRYYDKNYILSMNLSDLDNPVVNQIVISESSYINSIGLYQNHLIAGGGGEIYLLNVVDPNTIAVETSFDAGFVYHFYAHDTMLFVTRQGYGTDCYEMTDYLNPVYAGTIGYWAEKLIFRDNYLFVFSDYYGDILVHDISDLLNPIYNVSRVTYGGFNYDLEVTSDYAFISQDDRIAVLDISDPASLREVVMHPTRQAQDLELSNNRLFVAEGYDGWSVFDVTDPESPELLVEMDAENRVSQILVDDQFAYLAGGKGGIQIFDIADIYHPVLTASYATGNYFEKIHLVGTYLYAFEDGFGLKVIDISDKFSPIVVDSIHYNSGIRSMLDYQSILYVGMNGNSRVLDIADPAHPVDMGLIFSWQSPLDLFIQDEILYVTQLYRGLYLYDISDPIDPVFIDRYELAYATSDVFVQNDVIYLLDQLSGLSILQYGATTGITQRTGFPYLFTIYPNPASDWIQLEFKSLQSESTLFITNLSGKVLLKRDLPSGLTSTSLYISEFVPGIYLLSVGNTPERHTERFILH